MPQRHSKLVMMGGRKGGARRVILFVKLKHSVDDGNVAVLQLEDGNVPGNNWVFAIHIKEENVATLEARRHAFAEYNDNGALIVHKDAPTLPNHEGGKDEVGKAEQLKKKLWVAG